MKVMKKKPRRAPEPIEIEGDVNQKVYVIRRESHARCDVTSHELVEMIRDSLTDRGVNFYFSDELARGVVRNLLYGIPTPTEDKPVAIRDIDPMDAPLCKECEE